MNRTLFSSATDEWETPQGLFDDLNQEFHFTLDPCATPENAKCETYYTKEDNGLYQPWGDERVFCNPPYGRRIGEWVRKAATESALTVMLIPARTDTRWFRDWIYHKPNVEVRFIKGRLRFGNATENAPFPSMIVIFKGDENES